METSTAVLQAINALDYALAPYVHKSFVKEIKKKIREWMTFNIKEKIKDNPKWIDEIDFNKCRYTEYIDHDAKSDVERQRKIARNLAIQELNRVISQHVNCETDAQYIYSLACESVEEETKQAMEALIHNFNTLHSRAGSQVPFSSLGYGMNTTPEGRLIIRKLLDATWNGLGNGETPIFPIQVMIIKDGINYNIGDPNYDLFKYSMKVSAKRLFPNWVSIDSSFNLPYYKPDNYNTFVTAMGCRTRVIGNVNGPEETGGRGNFSFVTINLPMLAIEANKDIDKFYSLFDKYIQLSHDYLLKRYDFIKNLHVYNFPFLLGQHVWMGSENLNSNDTIESILKHASFSIGFCGLAECLVALIGKHHGESESAQKLGLEIIDHLRQKTEEYKKAEKMNWSTFSTPAESTAGSFLRATRKKYGVIDGITDKEYFTNSFHVMPGYKIRAIDKIRIEAPYHAKCDAGSISYIEMDGDPLKNLEAFEKIVRAMHDNDMGYFSVNHAVDRDPVCGYTGLIDNECPHCHRIESGHGHMKVKRIE